MTYNSKFLRGHLPHLLFLPGPTHFSVQQSHLGWEASFYNQDRLLSLKETFSTKKCLKEPGAVLGLNGSILIDSIYGTEES